MNSIRIGGKTVGENNPCFIIAEIGTAHNADLRAARDLVRAAARAGADCVKTQVVLAREIVHPACGAIELPGGKISLYDRFVSLETDAGFFREMKGLVEEQGLVFLASAFGLESARILKELGVSAVKIASPELNHFPLLDEVRTYRLPVVLSTGVSRLGDIEEALGRLPEETALLHCVTAYPAPEEEYNLRLVPVLARLFGRPVGVSDHSRDPELVPAAAVMAGACIVEKHFTLNRRGGGLDDPIALEEADFARLAAAVRKAEELGPAKAEAWLAKRFGRERLERVLGTGRKALAASEAGNYRTTRRSILAKKDIHQGESLSEANVALLRSEKNLSPGLHPRYLPVILGRTARRDIASGAGIDLEDV